MIGNTRTANSLAQRSGRRSDEVLGQIVGLIFEGRLSPGDRLPAERELAEQLGVSRPTLRDAINRLEVRGYIERRSKSGNYVCTAVPQSLREPIEDIVDASVVGFRDILDIRKALELWAVERAASSPTKKAIATLEECLKIMKSNAGFRTDDQFARHSEADSKFHQTIAEMAENPIYTHLFHFFANLIRRSIVISRQLMPDDFAAQNIGVHEQILKAIKGKDMTKAKEAMAAHFRFVEEHLSAKKPNKKNAKKR